MLLGILGTAGRPEPRLRAREGRAAPQLSGLFRPAPTLTTQPPPRSTPACARRASKFPPASGIGIRERGQAEWDGMPRPLGAGRGAGKPTSTRRRKDSAHPARKGAGRRAPGQPRGAGGACSTSMSSLKVHQDDASGAAGGGGSAPCPLELHHPARLVFH